MLYWRNDDGDQDGGALYRVAVNGREEPVRLTDGGDGEDNDLALSADGRQLAFSRASGNWAQHRDGTVRRPGPH